MVQFGQGSFPSGLLPVRVWTVILVYDKVCICAGSNIGRVEYIQAVGCEVGKWKGLHMCMVDY